MNLSRRRFLTISAAASLAPAVAQAASWTGYAFGAEASLTIHGPSEIAQPALAEALKSIRDAEALFSLYDRQSAISRLNADGVLSDPDTRFLKLTIAADQAYHLTSGLFDPTIQTLWATLAAGKATKEVLGTIGWDQVKFDTRRIRLGIGQSLTFNGVAQGFATDIVAEVLAAHGLTDVLINIGEHRGQGGPWKLALHDPVHGALGTRTLTTGAIATSSPRATMLGENGHILHRSAQPQWSTVSVEAPSATLADSVSTAMVLASRDEIEEIRSKTDITRITLVGHDGDLITL